MFVYFLPPIDLWKAWMSEDDYRRQIHERSEPDQEKESLAEYTAFKEKAFKLATKLGWEGDILGRNAPDVAGLPVEGMFLLGWRQGNHGMTFIASPFRLPFLERDVFEMIEA